MNAVASIRISTGGQNRGQRLAILANAHRSGLSVDTFVEARISSRRVAVKRDYILY
jgi:hypothetical protein